MMMSDAFLRRDTDKEARLYDALGKALNAFITEEPDGASNGVILAALSAVVGNALAYMCATSLAKDPEVREHVARVSADLDRHTWRVLNQMRQDHRLIMQAQPGWGGGTQEHLGRW
jgi:hypothetical protein